MIPQPDISKIAIGDSHGNTIELSLVELARLYNYLHSVFQVVHDDIADLQIEVSDKLPLQLDLFSGG